MRISATRALLAVALVIAPAAFAAAAEALAPQKPIHHATTTKSTAADHATMGVVKTVTGSALTISRSGKDAGDMAFVLNGSTKRDGKIEVGTPVSVRYREDGSSHVATAITAQHGKTESTAKKP